MKMSFSVSTSDHLLSHCLSEAVARKEDAGIAMPSLSQKRVRHKLTQQATGCPLVVSSALSSIMLSLPDFTCVKT